MSVILELGDNCIVLATRALREIADAFEDELGRRPTLAELCEILTWSARNGTAVPLVSDGGSHRGITIFGFVERGSRSIQLKTGDLVCVPHSSDQDAVLVYLGAVGSFGHAFGIVEDLVHPSDSLTKWVPASVHGHPVFVDNEYIELGRWSVKENRPDLVPRFRPPEMYYEPRDDPGDGSYEPYGLAESPSGELRKLTQRESEEIFGAVPGGFRHSFTGEEMEAYLRRLLPRSARN